MSLPAHLIIVELEDKCCKYDQATITKNDILCLRNEYDKFRLTLVIDDADGIQ
jgi:hypothetical protein